MIIYKVTNIINGMEYIGLTKYLLKDRRFDHIRCSKSKGRKCYFHKALSKYGLDNFKWKVIDECDNIIWLNELEKYYIYFYNTYNDGYNLTLGGKSTSGYVLSKETKRKISKATKGKKCPPPWNKGLSKETDERLRKISISMKGKNTFLRSEETKRKMREAQKLRRIKQRNRHN